MIATSDFELGLAYNTNVTKSNFIYMLKVGGLNIRL